MSAWLPITWRADLRPDSYVRERVLRVAYPDGNTHNLLPYLRGLAADEKGTVYAAGVGCHCVVRITPNGGVEPVLKAERPWSPTGVAVHDGAVYVLEYTHANEARARG